MRFRASLFLALILGSIANTMGADAVKAEARAVIGKVVPSQSGREIDWSKGEVSLVTRLPKPEKAFENPEEYRAWRNDPEVRFARENFRSVKTAVNPDGSFRVENLPPGTYALNFRLPDTTTNAGEIGSLQAEVVVPAASGKDAGDFDLGTLELPVKMRIGDPAPMFEVRTLADEPLRLADFRGKVVLLDFWATWCGPCLAEIPGLKELHEKFGKGGRFAIVSLSVDETPQVPKQYAARNNLLWVQGFAGSPAEHRVLQQYEVEAIPATFLIDAEGKLIAMDLHGDELKAAVEKALKPKQGE